MFIVIWYVMIDDMTFTSVSCIKQKQWTEIVSNRELIWAVQACTSAIWHLQPTQDQPYEYAQYFSPKQFSFTTK